MTFVLAADGRDEDVVGAFRRYEVYLASEKYRFPSGAYALATSKWWFDPRDHRSPHDAWLESVELTETRIPGKRPSGGEVTLRARLLGAYHDGYIELRYRQVSAYSMSYDSGGGHRDWRYDEFRVSEAGLLVHEVEWAGATQTGHWLIEASDLEYCWVPLG